MTNLLSGNNDTAAGYFVSAPWRSSGKTLLTLGLAAAARERGIHIQTFKKGPDYIDPMWLGKASGRPCFNLDPYMQSEAEMLGTFRRYAAAAQISLVEGTMGLHDGLACDGSDSNAAVSRLVNTPVILVADCRGMHRTVAALVKGVQDFDPSIPFAGLVLNRIRSQRHEDKIRAAIEHYTDMPLIGAIRDSCDVQIDERELGLLPASQTGDACAVINSAAKLVNDSCDIDHLFSIKRKPDQSGSIGHTDAGASVACQLTIGIARDEAFNFYYEDDLAELRSRGVVLQEISPLRDQFPEHLNGLLIGGGFPERFAAELAANQLFRSGLKNAIRAGLCVRAECGGLMYLCRSIALDNCNYPMVGAISGDVSLCRKPQGRGYVQLRRRNSGALLPGHEFHHSRIDFDKPPAFEYSVHRGYGVNGDNDGVRFNNVIASYTHFRHTSATPWIDWFLDQVAEIKYPEDSPRHV